MFHFHRNLINVQRTKHVGLRTFLILLNLEGRRTPEIELISDVLNGMYELQILHVTVAVLSSKAESIDVWRMSTKRETCSLVPKLISRFENGVFNPKIKYFPELFPQNYQNCSIKISLWNDPLSKNSTDQFLKILSEAFNFKPLTSYTFSNVAELKNGTTEATMAYCSHEPFMDYPKSICFQQFGFILAFSERKRLSTEKVLFLQMGWIMAWGFTISFLIFVIGVFLIENILRRKIDLIETNVKCFALAMGAPINICIYSSSTKFLVFVYIVIGIIMRSLDQGYLYNALTYNFTDMTPRNLKEAMSGGFDILYPKQFNATENVLKGSYGFPVSVKSFIKTEYSHLELIKQLKSLPQKTGIVTDTFVMGLYNQHEMFYNHNKAGIPYVLNNQIKTMNKCFVFQKNSYLVDPFNHYISILNDVGLLQMWSSKMDKQPAIGDKNPEVLRMVEFSVSAYSFLVCSLITCIVFCIEVLVWRRKK